MDAFRKIDEDARQADMTDVKGAKRNKPRPSASNNTARFRVFRREIELPSNCTASLGPCNWISRKLDRSLELFSNGLFIFSATRGISYFRLVRKTKWIGAISTLRVWKIHLEYFEISIWTESMKSVKKYTHILDLFFFFIPRKIIASCGRDYIEAGRSRSCDGCYKSINKLRAPLYQKQPPAWELTAYPRIAESTGPACSTQRSLSYLPLLFVHGRIMDLSRGAKASHIGAAHNRLVRLTLIGPSDLGGCFHSRCLRNLLGLTRRKSFTDNTSNLIISRVPPNTSLFFSILMFPYYKEKKLKSRVIDFVFFSVLFW